MTMYLHRDMERLKKKILSLSALVEESVLEALKAFNECDLKLAKKVIRADEEIDVLEIEVEDFCLKILALNQPVAIDLRFIVSVLKINSDLERIGDLAVNIAEQAMFRVRCPGVPVPDELDAMAQKAREMLRESLDSLVGLDSKLARGIFAEDDEVDAMLLEMYRQTKEKIVEHKEHVDCLMSILLVARHLERIADLATNIAEDVVYMIEGKIVRHRIDDEPAGARFHGGTVVDEE